MELRPDVSRPDWSAVTTIAAREAIGCGVCSIRSFDGAIESRALLNDRNRRRVMVSAWEQTLWRVAINPSDPLVDRC